MIEIAENIQVSFTRRKAPIPVDYRPLYKIALVLLIIVICGRGGRISLPKLQLFNWALRSLENQSSFISLLDGKLNFSHWSLDPTVVRAINFAIGENLCERKGGNIVITAIGQAFVIRLRSEDILRQHTVFLEKVGKQVTEEKVKLIAKDWLKEC